MRFSPFKNERHFEVVLIGIAIALGALHAWAGRFSMNPDGISYLDLGDAWMRGDWTNALSTYWSPLYALMLGLGMRIIQPSLWMEFPFVHAINFLIYFIALFAFRFFFHEFREGHSGHAWLCFGYAFFLVASLNLITLALVSPDMLIAAFVFAISGVMARIYQGDMLAKNFAWLGGLLGLAYLAKAVFFPLGFIFLGAAAFMRRPFRAMIPRVLLSLLVFLGIASMLIIPLSLKKGYFTFGDAGRLTYAWHVNGVTHQIHWQGGDDRFGRPVHPTRKIFDDPVVYEFREPVGGTYPPWYDPSYWYEGLKTPISIQAQIKAFLFNSRLLYEMLVVYQVWSVIIGLSILFWLVAYGRVRESMRAIGTAWPLLLPSLAAIGLYLLVVIQSRYVAPFFAAGGIVLWQRLHTMMVPDTRRIFSFAVGIVLALFLFLPVSIASIEKAVTPASKKNQQVAIFLREQGLHAGDKVAVVGDYFYAWEASWARLARVSIIAEIPPDFSNVIHFWRDKNTQSAVLMLLEEKGARMVIAGDPLPEAFLNRWQPIDGTSAYVLFFRKPQENQTKREEKQKGSYYDDSGGGKSHPPPRPLP